MKPLSQVRKNQLEVMQMRLREQLEKDRDFSWPEFLEALPFSLEDAGESEAQLHFQTPTPDHGELASEEDHAEDTTLGTLAFEEEEEAFVSLHPRQRIGDYELESELGRGGMGVVWRARQRKLDRTVALKMLHPHAKATDGTIRRFHQEARAVAHLQHPNIATLYEVGEHKGRLYFTMEYIKGQELGLLLQRGPLSAKAAARIALTLAETLQYTHKQGVIHRDLKPSNILVDVDGELHLMDFGIAKQLSEGESLTRTGSMIGTPGYMAPEQLGTSPTAVGPACDIYGLGAVLYKLLTCRAPYEGDSALEILQQSMQSAPLPPRLLHSKLPEDLEAICLKCLEREPGDRYPDAEALADDLRAFLEDRPVQAKHRSAFSYIARFLMRNTEHTTLMSRWSRIWQINGAQLFALFAITQLLFLTDTWTHLNVSLLWSAGFLSLLGVIWYFRLRKPIRFSPLERQMTKIWFIFAFNFLALAFFNGLMQIPQPGGGSAPMPSFFLMPIVLFEVGVAFACMAVVVGGEFFVVALPCAVLSYVCVFYPKWVFLIFGLCLSLGMILPKWKYGSQSPEEALQLESADRETRAS